MSSADSNDEAPALIGTPLENQAEPEEDVRMHRLLLYLRPRYAEEEYYGQLEALDLVNCLIAPVFFANALSMWTRGLLSTVYCVVLLLKGYQMGLLLLPNARRMYAHQAARYWLILGERVLRQFVATPLLGRGPRFTQWLRAQHATVPQALFCTRLMLLLSGFTISFWNAFCLPLGFVSQVAVNGIYFAIHMFGTLPQVAYVFQTLLRYSPQLLLLQQGLEQVLSTAVQLLQTLLLLLQPSSAAAAAAASTVAAAAVADASCSGSAAAVAAAAGASSTGEAGVCLNPAVAAATAVGSSSMVLQQAPCPDIQSVAGRFVLAATTAYMVFAVLLLPLYMAWRLERHLKSKWMATLPRAQQQLQQQKQTEQEGTSSSAAEAPQQPGPSMRSSSSCEGASSSFTKGAVAAGVAAVGGGTGMPVASPGSSAVVVGQPEKSFVFPPTVFSFMPDSSVLLKHLCIMAVVSLAAGQALVLACWLVPGLLGMFKEQIVF